jgi:HK97 family phage major capsid protein
MPTSVELREERRKVILQAQELVEKAEKENRSMSDEESSNYKRAMNDAGTLKDRIERLEETEKLSKELSEIRSQDKNLDSSLLDNSEKKSEEVEKRKKQIFNAYLRGGIPELSYEQRSTMQKDNMVNAGYLVAPQQFVSELIKEINDLVYIKAASRVFQLSGAHSLGAPKRTSRASDFDFTGELTQAARTNIEVGKRELKPKYLSKEILVSKPLLRNSSVDGGADAIVREELAYVYGITLEKAFLTGSNPNEPLGVFTASNDGISTARDVSTGNTATAVKFDGLKSAKGSLKAGYKANAVWMFHRDVITQISKEKDGNGRYLMQDSVVQGEPDRLLGLPVLESEFAPNTMTSGLYVGILGDWRNYWIAEALNFELQRLDELYARTNEVGFIARGEIDGMPVLEEAFARVQLA